MPLTIVRSKSKPEVGFENDDSFLARDAFVRTNRRAIAMMFVRLSVCLSGTGVHCDHTVHFSADFSLLLDSPMFWLP